MKSKILFVFSLITLFQDSLGVLQCSVTDNVSKEEKQCVFPFVLDSNLDFKNIECTNQNDPDGKYWCSTKVDENGIHQGGDHNISTGRQMLKLVSNFEYLFTFLHSAESKKKNKSLCKFCIEITQPFQVLKLS